MKRRMYDFDWTIYRGDATARFYRRCLCKYPRAALDFLGSFWWLLGMVLKMVEKTRAKERFFGFLRFVPDVEKEVLDFWVANAHRIKRWYLEDHRSSDLVISASPEFLLTPICESLRVELIGSRVDPHTGRYTGLNCHGAEKLRRLRERYADIEIEAFYSDSLSDAPLAELADAAFLVRDERVMRWPDAK